LIIKIEFKTKKMNRFQNKVVIITGAASGIGKVAALKFAKENATVIIWDYNEIGAQSVADEIIISGDKASFQKVNTKIFDEVKLAADKAFQEFGKIDILINNAGITRDASLQKMTAEQWQEVIDVNLTGVFNCTKAVSPFMIENKFGRIINTSSVVALYGNFGQSNYVASKSGLIGLTKVWARELGKYNITVNAVAPGFIATEMIDTIPEKIIEQFKSRSPLQRMGTPEDIANAYLFLASDDASYITGTVLSVDGGLTV
jgi:3-oxoacyl-[acyl-carrier protein] reductase